jgi:hypothetical protein
MFISQLPKHFPLLFGLPFIINLSTSECHFATLYYHHGELVQQQDLL